MIRTATRLATVTGAALALTAGAIAAPTPAAAEKVINGSKTISIYDHQVRSGKLDLTYKLGESFHEGRYCLWDLKGNGDGVYMRVNAIFTVYAHGFPRTVQQSYTMRNTSGSGRSVCGRYVLRASRYTGRLDAVSVTVANTDGGKLYGSSTTRIRY